MYITHYHFIDACKTLRDNYALAISLIFTYIVLIYCSVQCLALRIMENILYILHFLFMYACNTSRKDDLQLAVSLVFIYVHCNEHNLDQFNVKHSILK